MYITVIGTGYVGLVTAVCLAEKGNHITCVDIDAEKIARLQQGITPIFEPGLEALLKRNYEAGRLEFITQLADETHRAEIYMIATGTPSREDGSAEMRYVFSAAEAIAHHLEDYAIVIDKSTVPVGTSEQVQAIIQKILVQRAKDFSFDVVSNPEFLKEGAAIKDFMEPDRIIIGTDSLKAVELLRELYLPFLNSAE
ncbi:MAG TPA: nucleotide sugar dehydrogenase, partial [Coxiellaceae bacterium]|nr:nucleotide sugar dehydrogenase [Coxiellaceae bacterium]